MLEIKDLRVNYGNLQTTLLKAISGLKKVESGNIIFDGIDISKLSPAKIAEQGIVQVPEGRKLFPNMSVLENLELGAYLKNPRKKRKETQRHCR